MTKVKDIFFLTKGECDDLIEKTGDKFINYLAPHFTLEDGTVMYGKIGGPSAYDTWHEPLKV